MSRAKNPKYESMSLEELKVNMEKSKKQLEHAIHNKNILEQRKKLVERGTKLIRKLLADKKEISIRELDEKAKGQGISVRTMRDVRNRMKNELEYRTNEKQENSIRLKD